jgi:hypothetical protein
MDRPVKWPSNMNWQMMDSVAQGLHEIKFTIKHTDETFDSDDIKNMIFGVPTPWKKASVLIPQRSVLSGETVIGECGKRMIRDYDQEVAPEIGEHPEIKYRVEYILLEEMVQVRLQGEA